MDEPIDDDTTVGELFRRASELAEAAAPAVHIADALAEGCRIGAFIVIQKGGFEGYDWTAHMESPIASADGFPMDASDLDDFLLAESLLLTELVALRHGFKSIGVTVPDTHAAIIARVGREVT